MSAIRLSRRCRVAIGLAATLLAASAIAPCLLAESAPPAGEPSASPLPVGPPPKIVMEPAPAPASPASAEKGEPAAPASAPSEKAESPAPAADKPGETAPKKPEPPKKFLTPEDYKELPTFSQFDDASWEALLAKGKTLLEDVKDNTFGYDEKAFYWLVAHVNKMPDDLLKPDEETLAYKTLLAVPSMYRGQPVTLRGQYMYVAPFEVTIGALKRDVPKLYECTVRELPMDQVRPMCTVITIENPLTYLKPGDDVLVKGYFYKIREFEGTKGPGHAPLLIAKRLTPETAAEGTETVHTGTPGSGLFSDPYLILMIMVIAIMMIGFFYIKQRNKPKSHARDRRTAVVHKFRLRRPDLAQPPDSNRPGGEGGGPQP
jgi:hypothetical protein